MLARHLKQAHPDQQAMYSKPTSRNAPFPHMPSLNQTLCIKPLSIFPRQVSSGASIPPRPEATDRKGHAHQILASSA